MTSRTPAPSFVYLVGRVDRGVRSALQQRLADHGLSVAELTTLSVLRARPSLSNAQLARRALITPQSMNDVLAGLERRGLVARTVDPEHRRILRARLTRSGSALLRRADREVAEIEDDVLADVPPHEREIVVRGLASCMQRLRTAGAAR